jgi:hypothetical protein
MNDEEKRLKKNEYQRNLRQKNKLKSIVIKPDLVIDTDTTPLKRKPKKAKKCILKQSSIITYTSKLGAFHKRMTGLPLSQNIIDAIKGIDYDKKAVQDEFKYMFEKIDYIKNNELSSIPTICKIFTKITGFIKLIKELVPIKRNIEKAESIRRNDTTINHDDIISFDKHDLLLNSSKLTDDSEKLLYLLMTFLPTRRLDDYRSMYYGPNDGNHFDDDFIHIKNSCTKNKKNISIQIPTELKILLPKAGYILGKQFSISALSLKFFNIMKKIYGKKIGALDLRRMYLTTINISGASFRERKFIADNVGHSVEESIKYSMKVI